MKNKDFFYDGLLIFLDYIERQLKKNSDYNFHPIIRAFMLAFEAVKKVKKGETAMGLSGENVGQGDDASYHIPFAVVMKNRGSSQEVLEIRDLQNGKTVPIDLLITIFRLQINLDKIEGDVVSPSQMAEVLTKVMPCLHFYALGNRWLEARDLLVKKMRDHSIALPPDQNLINGLSSIKLSTPWEEYPREVRALIGAHASELFDRRGGTIIISSPTNSRLHKVRVFEFALQIFNGNASQYMMHGSQNCVFCKFSDVKDSVLSIWDNFIVIADKYPLVENHILVISKNHIHALGDAPKEHLEELGEIISSLTKFYLYVGSKFIMFDPGTIGRSIHHAHIHFIPGDYLITPAFDSLEVKIKNIIGIEKIWEFYRDNGPYVLWGDGSSIQVGTVNTNKSNISFRSLISSQLLDSQLADYSKYKEEKLAESKKLKQRLIDNWKRFTDSSDKH